MLNSPFPFQLGPMTMAHIDAVIEIDRVAFPTPVRRSLLTYELTKNDLAHYQVLMHVPGRQEDKLIAYSGYWMIADELHVSTIAVDPAWRRRGLGELLLLNMLFMGNEHGAQLATLEVRQRNQAAQELYRKYQFEEVGSRRNYYRDTGDNATLMTVQPLDARYYQVLENKRDLLFARLSGQSEDA